MSTHYTVPYYANTPDNTHCVQACYRMILKYFLSEQDFSWDELDKKTAKQKDMWTWPMAGLCWLQEIGFDVKYIENFDFQAFLDRKEDYLIEHFGPDVGNDQIIHSDVQAEMQWTEKFLQNIQSENRVPNVNEITQFLDNGYLLTAMVNYRPLYDLEGYAGHCIVINGYADKYLIINDPNSPDSRETHVSYERFIKAWSYPDKTANNITALKPV